MDKLKPCPFCESDPKHGLKFMHEYDGIFLRYFVKCEKCNIRIVGDGIRCNDFENNISIDEILVNREETVKRWNHRTDFENEIIRCFACAFYDSEHEMCKVHNYPVITGDYCSYAERKKEE